MELDEARHRLGTRRRRVPDGVGDAHPLDVAIDGGAVEPLQRSGLRTRRVFGHVHHGDVVLVRELDRFLAHVDQLVDRPSFRELTDRARKNE
jgi:hypothetical protein